MKNICGYSKNDLKVIREFIKSINNEITVRISPNGEFCVLFLTYKLHLGMKKKPDYEKEVWKKWYRQQKFYNGEDINPTILSILHEIGHFQTFNVEEWTTRNKEVNKALDLYYDNKIDMETLNFMYWDTINEYKATQWAIDYYVNNKAKCECLAREIRV